MTRKRSKRVQHFAARIGGVLLLLGIFMAASAAPTHAQTVTPVPTAVPTAVPPSGCIDGADVVTGDPCLDIQAESLMTQIFKWANAIIPILLPLIAIAIGITFGGSILAGIRNIFGNIKIG